MSEVIYRQRLTGIGWFGAIIFVTGQIVGSLAVARAVSASMSTYGDPNGPIILALGCGAVVFSGLVMVLVGREYYPFTPPALPIVAPLIDERASKRDELSRRIEEQYGKQS